MTQQLELKEVWKILNRNHVSVMKGEITEKTPFLIKTKTKKCTVLICVKFFILVCHKK